MDCDDFRWNQMEFDRILIDGIMLTQVKLCEIGWILWNFTESIRL